MVETMETVRINEEGVKNPLSEAPSVIHQLLILNYMNKFQTKRSRRRPTHHLEVNDELTKKKSTSRIISQVIQAINNPITRFEVDQSNK